MKKTKEPDMTNHLAEIQRKNVQALMAHHDMLAGDLAELSGLSDQTIRNTFGTSKKRIEPTKRTMSAIYIAFDLTEGSLERPDFDPAAVTIAPSTAELPSVITQTSVRLSIGRTNIDTELSAEDAEKVLRFVVFGDSL